MRLWFHVLVTSNICWIKPSSECLYLRENFGVNLHMNCMNCVRKHFIFNKTICVRRMCVSLLVLASSVTIQCFLHTIPLHFLTGNTSRCHHFQCLSHIFIQLILVQHLVYNFFFSLLWIYFFNHWILTGKLQSTAILRNLWVCGIEFIVSRKENWICVCASELCIHIYILEYTYVLQCACLCVFLI